jgi:hypothetical protein
MALLLTALAPEMASSLGWIDDPRVAIRHLEKAYGSLTYEQKEGMIHEIQTLTVPKAGGPVQYVMRIRSLRHALLAADVLYGEAFFVDACLAAISRTHKSVGDSIRMTCPATLEELAGRVMMSSFDGPTLECQICRRHGHGAASCPQRHSKPTQVLSQTTHKPKVYIAVAGPSSPKDGTQQPAVSFTTVSNNIGRLSVRRGEWILDSGSSISITGERDAFDLLHPHDEAIVLPNGSDLRVVGKGTVHLKLNTSDGIKFLSLTNVYFSPACAFSLLSVRQLNDIGCKVRFEGRIAELVLPQDGAVVRTKSRKRSSGLFLVRTTESVPEAVGSCNKSLAAVRPSNATRASSISIEEYHQHMGHLHERALRDAAKNSQPPIELSAAPMRDCIFCLLGKSTRADQNTDPVPEPEEVGDMVVADLIGPFPRQSLYGGKFISVIMDRKSRWTDIQFLRTKSNEEVLRHIKCFVMWLKNSLGHKVRMLRTDNGREYIHGDLKDFLDSEGIEHEFTAPYTPAQNGTVERKNRSLEEAARTALIEHKLPDSMWSLAIRAAAHIQNRLPHSALGRKSPYEVLRGQKPDTRGLRGFGTFVVAHDHGQSSAMSPTGVPCILVGYGKHPGTYDVLPLTKGARPISSGHVRFPHDSAAAAESFRAYQTKCRTTRAIRRGDTSAISPETSLGEPQQRKSETVNQRMEDQVPTHCLQKEEVESQVSPSRPQEGEVEASPPDETRDTPLLDEIAEDYVEHLASTNSTHVAQSGRMKRHICNLAMKLNTSSAVATTPRGPKGDNGEVLDWQPPCDAEMKSWKDRDVAKVVPKPLGQKILRAIWVMTIKRHPDGAIKKLKARCTADGSEQIQGIDCGPTYSPTADPISLRFLMAYALENGYQLHGIDIRTAYLNAPLHEEVYLEIPRYSNNWGDRETHCLKLNRAVYGLKQSGRAWYNELKDKLYKIGFHELTADKAVFSRMTPNGKELVGVHVDDLIIVSPTPETMASIKDCIKRFFDIEDNGPLSSILGLQIHRDPLDRWIEISQENAVNAFISEYAIHPEAQSETPMSPDYKPEAVNPECDSKDILRYQILIGHLMYFARMTRPDIQFAVALMARYSNGPRASHFNGVQRIVEYLRRTSGWKFRISKGKCTEIGGYTDADFANCPQDATSTSGFLGTLGGSPIAWGTTKQKMALRSTACAEVVALSQFGERIQWMRLMAQEICDKVDLSPSLVYCDNNAVVLNTNNQRDGKTSKTVWIAHNIVSQMVAAGDIKISHIRSADNAADFFTKPLGFELFTKHRAATGMIGPNSLARKEVESVSAQH